MSQYFGRHLLGENVKLIACAGCRDPINFGAGKTNGEMFSASKYLLIFIS